VHPVALLEAVRRVAQERLEAGIHLLRIVDRTLLVPEQPLTQRAAVNGDGDSDDNALFWFDVDSSGVPPVVVPPTPQLIGIATFVIAPPVAVDEDTLLFATSELMSGVDLNGDRDTQDTMLRVAFRPPPPSD